MHKTKLAPLLTAKRRAHDILRRSQQRTTRLLQNYLLAKRSNRPLPDKPE